jgi:hypothetical protein
MPLLPAVVPTTIEKRADRVPARLARNVAPLFGVVSPVNPFGTMTWLCDFNLITISEIARGAPSPTRAQARELGTISTEWTVHNRAIVAARPLPNEIINATTNRFGPHTKSAVLLTATNVLLEPVTSAIETALPLLCEGLPLRLRIVAWATAAIEAFRSQPALVIAATKARVIQRESLDSPRFAFAPAVRERPLARCEIGADADEPGDPVTRPRDLHFLDRTVSCLRLSDPVATADDATIDLESDDTRPPARNLGDELVDHLIQLLLDASHPEGVGYVWASEPTPGQAVAEAMLPASGIVEDLVDQWFTVHRDEAEATLVAQVRMPAQTEGLSLPARRVIVLAALGLARTLRFDLGNDLRLPDFLGLLDDIGTWTGRCLDAGDPVHAVVDVRLAALRVAVLRHDQKNRIEDHVDALVQAATRSVELLAAGVLDRGTVADLLSAACIELNPVRLTNATDPDSGLPTPKDLTEVIRGLWVAYAQCLELDLAAADPDAGFHLHNYATFLGSLPDQPDQREAVRLFRDYVIPSRKRLYRRLNHFGPLGVTYYIATATTSRLSESARDNGDTAAAAEWAALGHKWISAALQQNPVDRVVGRGSESEAMFALRAAPALLLAIELGVVPVAGEIDRVQGLLKVLDRWSVQAAGKDEEYNRHAEVADIRSRAAALAAGV